MIVHNEVVLKTYRKYKKLTTTIGRCNECQYHDKELVIKGKFCSEKCYEKWCEKQTQITCRGVCSYKFCDYEGTLKYNGRYCSKICRNAQSHDNKNRKIMLDEGLPLETIDRRIKRTPVDNAHHLFGDLAQTEDRIRRTKLRERRNTINDINYKTKVSSSSS